MQDKQINIIQFMPYFPPHKWWVETVWQEIANYWTEKGYWNFINVITEFEQEKILNNKIDMQPIIYESEVIWYTKDWYDVIVMPSLEIINNFPIYKFWTKKYKVINRYLKDEIWEDKNNFRVITHTRFFLTSLIWWIFAKKNKLKWIHIEHWSDYVKLSSKLKTKLSIIYDKIFWKWIFKKADKLLAISNACKEFINNEFIKRDVEIFYRGLDLPEDLPQVENLKEKFPWKIIVWFIWRIMKWKNVDSLVKAYYQLDNVLKDKIQVVIIWDWEDFDTLKQLDTKNRIYFTGWKPFNEALAYQKQFDIHTHTSSPWWWLATTLLQAMNYWCLIVATPNEWAKEVIENYINWFLLKNDSVEEIKKWLETALNNFDKKQEFTRINKQIIQEKFSRNKQIEKLSDLVK